MNAKETLKKIAEALNIVGEEVKDKVEDVVEAVVDVAEDVAEAVVDVAEAVEEKVADVIDAVGDKLEDAGESLQDSASQIDPEKDRSNEDERVKELESQLNDLKKLLKDAMAEPELPALEPIKEETPKGLTHSPEKEVKKASGQGIGRKGASIQERVHKYINNN
tara:strand:+ start:14253 stop:14744 length:492 start_codon:yes stop_codon:yes gene_type:complete